MERKSIACFINMPAAEHAGQAAVQGTKDNYRVVRKYCRGAVLGYAVRLYTPNDVNNTEAKRYIME